MNVVKDENADYVTDLQDILNSQKNCSDSLLNLSEAHSDQE